MIKRINTLCLPIAAGLTSAIMLSPATALAAKNAAEHGEAHGGGGGGLPQFDPSTYSSQLFWLLVTFFLLYFIFNTKTLPDISSVLENRKERIQSDLATAEKLRNDAEQAQNQYEALLEKARSESTRLMNGVTADMQKKSEEQIHTFQEKSQKKIKELESNVRKAKQDAMKDMNEIAAEVARDAAEKIVGIKADLNQAKTVVQSLSSKEAA